MPILTSEQKFLHAILIGHSELMQQIKAGTFPINHLWQLYFLRRVHKWVKKHFFLNVLYEEINLNVPNKVQNVFDLHYLYANTKCSLVGAVQKTKQSKKRKRQQEQFGNHSVIWIHFLDQKAQIIFAGIPTAHGYKEVTA